MTAEVHRIDGGALDLSKRNERVASWLNSLVEINNEGGIQAALTVYVTPEGSWGVGWSLPDSGSGFPWDLAMRGALAQALTELGIAAIHQSPTPLPDKGA